MSDLGDVILFVMSDLGNVIRLYYLVGKVNTCQTFEETLLSIFGKFVNDDFHNLDITNS